MEVAMCDACSKLNLQPTEYFLLKVWEGGYSPRRTHALNAK